MDDALRGLVADEAAGDPLKGLTKTPVGAPLPAEEGPAHPVWNQLKRNTREVVQDTKNAFSNLAEGDNAADYLLALPEAVGGVVEGLVKQAAGGLIGLVKGGDAEAVRKVTESPNFIAQNKVAGALSEIIAAPFKEIHALGDAAAEAIGGRTGAAIGAGGEALADLWMPGKLTKALKAPGRVGAGGAAAGKAGLEAVAADPVMKELLGADTKPPLQDLVQAGEPAAPEKPVTNLQELQSTLNQTAGRLVADKIQMFRLLKATTDGTTEQQRTDMHYHREDPQGHPLDKDTQVVYDKVWKPLAEAYDKTLQLLRGEDYQVPNQSLAVRVVKRMGGTLDRLVKGDEADPTGAGKLRTSKSGSEYGRTMWALEGAPEVGGFEVFAENKDSGARVSVGKAKTAEEAKSLAGRLQKDEAWSQDKFSVDEVVTRPAERHVAHLGRGDDGRITVFRDGDATDLGPKKISTQDEKTFITDKDGRTFKLDQATTKEIETATSKEGKGGVQYYKDLPANYAHRYLELLKVKRARDIVEGLKKSPLFQELATQDPQVALDKNWRPTTLPQFRGWHFDPRIREMLDDFHGEGAPGSAWLRVINNAFIKPMFAIPFMHMRNEITWHFKERGLVSTVTHIPEIYRDAKAAIADVTAMTPEYLQYMRQGANMMRGKVFAQKFDGQMQKMFANRVLREQFFLRYAKATGRAPMKVLDVVMDNFSNPTLWGSHDVALMMSLRRQQRNGKSFAQALEHSERLGITYQARSRAFGRDSAGALGEAGRTMELVGRTAGLFWRYRTDELRAYYNTLHDLVVGSKDHPIKTRIEAADQLAMIGFLAFVYYPVMSKVWQSVFHNPAVKVNPAGSAKEVVKLQQWLSGNIEAQEFLNDVFSFGPAISVPYQMATNRDTFSGRRIYGDDPRAEGAGNFLLDQIPLVADANKLRTGKKTPQQTLAAQVGVSVKTPKQAEAAKLREQKRSKRLSDLKRGALRRESLE